MARSAYVNAYGTDPRVRIASQQDGLPLVAGQRVLFLAIRQEQAGVMGRVLEGDIRLPAALAATGSVNLSFVLGAATVSELERRGALHTERGESE